MPGALELSQAPLSAGGKAYQLGQLLLANFPVPTGYCFFHGIEESQILRAWRELGEVPVALRSSALQEDSHHQSQAGLFETRLAVSQPRQIVAGVREILQGLEGSVVMQPMLEVAVSGVVFTQDPTIAEDCLKVEAIPGRGDRLVSGLVTPSAWHCRPGQGPQLLAGNRCLNETELQSLIELCLRIRQHRGIELDLEFAFDQLGKLWILQARPITASQRLRQELRQREILRVRQLAGRHPTAWSLHQMAETLPAPLPLTWSVVEHMTSLQGAYGRLLQELGYDPDPALKKVSLLDRIAGRPYHNLHRAARALFRDFPFDADLETLQRHPERAAQGALRFNARLINWRFWLGWPLVLMRILQGQATMIRSLETFERDFLPRILPPFLERIHHWTQQSLESLSVEDLLARFQEIERATCWDFASQSLKASCWAMLRMAEHRKGPPPRAQIPPQADLRLWLHRAQSGEIHFDELLEVVGHRGPQEMELASPRWKERPDHLRAQLEQFQAGTTPPAQESPLARALGLREAARHWLLLGWAEMRRTLLALDNRLGLQGDIFWLDRAELTAPPIQDIPRRKQEHRLLQSLPCPTLLFSQDAEAIGRRGPESNSPQLRGTPLSWGCTRGKAMVVSHPDRVPPQAQDFILVCASSDPAYASAMSRARGLIVETGGVLSHGAILARELGLPAVAGIPMGQVSNGEWLELDGESGAITRIPG